MRKIIWDCFPSVRKAGSRSANAHLSDDETVAKMGHPVVAVRIDVGHPPEYLSLLDQLLECRDDDRFKLLQANLKEVLRFEGVRPHSNSFIERYIRGEATLHIHWRFSGNLVGQGDFCAMLQASA